MQESGSWVESDILLPSDGHPNDPFGFGFDVAIDSTTAVVTNHFDNRGLPGDDDLTIAGSSFVYTRDESGSWVEFAKLVSSTREIGANFGNSVDIDLPQIIVGESNSSLDADGENSFNGAGAAHIFTFEGGAWEHTVKLVASDRTPAATSHFGHSVSISKNNAVIGAYVDPFGLIGDDEVSQAGSAYFLLPK